MEEIRIRDNTIQLSGLHHKTGSQAEGFGSKRVKIQTRPRCEGRQDRVPPGPGEEGAGGEVESGEGGQPGQAEADGAPGGDGETQ